jgi:trimethylamine:corrinoid methyltransferase-like protein
MPLDGSKVVSSAGFEKFITDIDLLQGLAEYLTPLDVSEEALAVEAIRDVGPAGHFFGTRAHSGRVTRMHSMRSDRFRLAQL